MKLIIEMSLDNAAFEEGGTDEAITAITNAMDHLRGVCATGGGVKQSIRDSNGNKVGTAEITED